MDIVKLAIRNARLTLSVLVFLVIAGALAYRAVPKEAEPDVAIPIMYVSLVYQGISPEDAERLLLRPVEAQLKSLKGLKEMKSERLSGRRQRHRRVRSLRRSRRCADRHPQQGAGRQARPAAGVEEPTVNEVNLSEFPVVFVTLSGDVPGARADRRRQGHCATASRKCPACWKATIQGSRDELVEAIIDPMKLCLLRPAARPADPGHRRVEQPCRRRRHRRLGRQIRRQGAGADRDAGGCRQPAGRRRPERRGAGRRISPPCARPSRMPRRSPASTASRAIAIEVKKRIGANVVETIEGAKKVAEQFVARASRPCRI